MKLYIKFLEYYGTVSVTFEAPISAAAALYQSLLLMVVKPHGPFYETPMTARVTRPQPSLLSSCHFLAFGCLPLGQSTQQSLTLKNKLAAESVNMRLEIGPATRDYQIVHEETWVNSREVLLDGCEELSVTLNFCPSAVGCIDTSLRIRVIGTTFQLSIPLSGYEDRSEKQDQCTTDTASPICPAGVGSDLHRRIVWRCQERGL